MSSKPEYFVVDGCIGCRALVDMTKAREAHIEDLEAKLERCKSDSDILLKYIIRRVTERWDV